MNPGLARLRAAIVKNKVPIGVLGAGAVAALAWRSRSSSPATSPDASTADGTVSTTPYYSAGGQTAGASGYDSTASDVYNAIQPQLEELRELWANAQTPIPVPEQAPPTAATVTGYFRPKGSPAVFQALSDGTRRLVDLPEYIALGKPKETELPANDAFFKRPTA